MEKETVIICTYTNHFLRRSPVAPETANLPRAVTEETLFTSIDEGPPQGSGGILENAGKETLLASSIPAWAAYLKAQGVERVVLHYLEKGTMLKKIIIGVFAGYLLEAVKKGGRSDLYIPRHGPEVNFPSREEPRVKYYRVGEDVLLDLRYPRDLSAVKERLRKVLLANRKMVERAGARHYLREFDAAIHSLEPGSTFGQEEVVPALAPPGYLSQEAVQVLAACRPALKWVGSDPGDSSDSSGKAVKRLRAASTRLEAAYSAARLRAVNSPSIV